MGDLGLVTQLTALLDKLTAQNAILKKEKQQALAAAKLEREKSLELQKELTKELEQSKERLCACKTELEQTKDSLAALKGEQSLLLNDHSRLLARISELEAAAAEDRASQLLKFATLANEKNLACLSLQQAHERSKKSSVKMLLEKDAQAHELKETIAQLTSELKRGGGAESLIKSTATLQASLRAEVRTLSAQCKQLEKDRDAGLLREQQLRLTLESLPETELHLPYLRAVLLQFLSFPEGSTDRGRMLPVIATVLRLSDQERQAVVDAMATLNPVFEAIKWWRRREKEKCIDR